jgi:hypothetical protein
MKELLALLRDVDHTDFRDARGPMGLTQRQAAGKFTRDEAEAFIARLQGNELDGSALAAAPAASLSLQEQLMRHLPAEQLAVELRRRDGPSPSPRGRAGERAQEQLTVKTGASPRLHERLVVPGEVTLRQ